MREIIFRGLRTDGKGWAYGYYLKKTFHNKLGDKPILIYEKHFICCNSDLELFDSLFEQVEVIPETVGQYTGLKDKKGKDIYEGDIVLVPSGTSTVLNPKDYGLDDNISIYKKSEPKEGFIEWYDGSFRINKVGDDSKNYFGVINYTSNNYNYQLVIIGNIHEPKTETL